MSGNCVRSACEISKGEGDVDADVTGDDRCEKPLPRYGQQEVIRVQALNETLPFATGIERAVSIEKPLLVGAADDCAEAQVAVIVR